MGTNNTMNIAESFTDDVFGPQHDIMAGDEPSLATRDALIVGGTGALPQYTPLAFDTGAYIPWVAGKVISGMTMYAVPASTDDQRVAIATAGMFNIDAVTWPDATTEDQVAAATVNAQMQFRKLLYSDKRTDLSGVLVGPSFEAPVTG